MNTKRKRLARNIAPPQESSDDEIDTQNKRTRNPVNDVCPICLCSLRGLEYYAKPDTCDHRYCFDCLEEWSKTQNSCPSDRNPYSSIILKESATNQTVVEFHVEDRNQMDTPREEANDEPLHCAICNDCRRGDCMLCCSSCELGFHYDCLDPPLYDMPQGDWTCDGCSGPAAKNSPNLLESVFNFFFG